MNEYRMCDVTICRSPLSFRVYLSHLKRDHLSELERINGASVSVDNQMDTSCQ